MVNKVAPTEPLADANGPVVHAIFKLARMNRAVVGNLLRPYGLFPGQEMLMMQLWERDGRSQTELVNALGLDPSTVTKMLRRMERAGLVQRQHSQQDRRVVIITLTPDGRRLRREVEKAWQELERQTTEPLSERQRQQLRSMLKRVEEHVRLLGAEGTE